VRRALGILLLVCNSTVNAASFSSFGELINKAIAHFSTGIGLTEIFLAPSDIYGLKGEFGCGSWSGSVDFSAGPATCSEAGLSMESAKRSATFDELVFNFFVGSVWSYKNTGAPVSVSYFWKIDEVGNSEYPYLVSREVLKPSDNPLFGRTYLNASGQRVGADIFTLRTGHEFVFAFEGIFPDEDNFGRVTADNFVFSRKSALTADLLVDLTAGGLISAIDVTKKTVSPFFEILNSIPGSTCRECQVRKAISDGEEQAKIEQYRAMQDGIVRQCLAGGNSVDSCFNLVNGVYENFGVSFSDVPTDPKGLTILRENSPAYVGFEVSLPEFEEGRIVFPFLPEDIGDGDILTLWKDDVLIWATLGYELQNNVVYLAEIDAGLLSSFSGALSFILMSVGESQARIVLPDFSVSSITYVAAPVSETNQWAFFLVGFIFLIGTKFNGMARVAVSTKN
ncbi:hypothetical protein, partial [Methyloversatilis sp.]|uniref:hypothetical protein n=1 Tax=Methyloversatilis sp. TaxID=2569862 RepID=UPI002734EB80